MQKCRSNSSRQGKSDVGQFLQFVGQEAPTCRFHSAKMSVKTATRCRTIIKDIIKDIRKYIQKNNDNNDYYISAYAREKFGIFFFVDNGREAFLSYEIRYAHRFESKKSLPP